MAGALTIGLVVIWAADWCAAQELSKDAFSCEGRGTGYYADVSTGCQVYHMCDGLGRQFSYTCPNATLFQQRMLICDHWYMVNCSKSIQDYGANLLIGQNKPFVEDSVSQPYARTPRPDLLSVPTNASEYKVIYRTRYDPNLSPKNLVGAESEDEDSTEPTYFPPSHWSTEVPIQYKNTSPVRRNFYQESSQPNNIFRTNYKSRSEANLTNGPKAKAIQVESPSRNSNNFSSNKVRSQVPADAPTRYKSTYKATTPVYPSSVEDASQSLGNVDLLPPLPYSKSRIDHFANRKPPVDLVPPNLPETDRIDSSPLDNTQIDNKFSFPSNFEATTPVYPSLDELTKSFVAKLTSKRPGVNFRSDFVATTPVYPNSVDPTSPDPNQVGILPPRGNRVNFESKYEATTPQYPTSVAPTSPDPQKVGLLPPKGSDIRSNFESHFKATTPQIPTSIEPTSPNPSEAGLLPPKGGSFVNFQSNFKATTPQYPNFVNPSSQNPNEVDLLPPKVTNFVNFESGYNATTPQYPNHVEATSPDPSQVGLLAPDETAPGSKSEAFSSLPSKFYEPPKYDQDQVDDFELQEQPGIRMLNFMKSFNRSQWQDLMRVFHIPEYDFPLDDATRPSYDSVVNSFEARSVKKR